MIKSMTGFSRWEQEADGFRIRTELKSVNHRYLDLSVRLEIYCRFSCLTAQVFGLQFVLFAILKNFLSSFCAQKKED